jgi:hypothetical protein
VLLRKEILMRTALLMLSLLALPGLPLSAAAPQDPGSYPTKKVTLHLHQVPLRKAVETLFRDTGREYLVHPVVADVLVSLDLENADFRDALKALLARAGAIYRVERPAGRLGAVWFIGKDPRAPREITATLGPVTATLEIVVPAALKQQVTVVSRSGTTTGADGQPQTEGSVVVCFPHSVCVEFRQAQVKVMDDAPNGDRRLLISPLATSTASR